MCQGHIWVDELLAHIFHLIILIQSWNTKSNIKSGGNIEIYRKVKLKFKIKKL